MKNNVFCTIKKRRDFLYIGNPKNNHSFHAKTMIVLVAREKNSSSGRFGFTITKKLGNAVTRNLLKRRMREICKKIYSNDDIVIILRPNAKSYDYSTLSRDFAYCMKMLKNTTTS